MHSKISISIVSHSQKSLALELLNDLTLYCGSSDIEVILTLNLPEDLLLTPSDYPFSITIIQNQHPLGFGANHNQAYAQATGLFFCAVNPDIRFNNDPFPALLSCLQNPSVGLVAPIVFGGNGEMEDSARRFPTPFKILCKVFGGCKGSDYAVESEIIFPDWLAGMFMLFPRDVFKRLGGFNQRYFLYYEDVDICARLRLQGYEVALCPAAKVIHYARRDSHRDIKFLKWHLTSMLHFFCSAVFFQVFWRKLIRANVK